MLCKLLYNKNIDIVKGINNEQGTIKESILDDFYDGVVSADSLDSFEAERKHVGGYTGS